MRKLIKYILVCAIILVCMGKYIDDQRISNCRIDQIESQQKLLVEDANNTLPVLINKVMPSVVYIEVPGQRSGSGVIIGPDVVLTASHVIQDANELFIETIDGEKYEAIRWVVDEHNDCGLIYFLPGNEFESIAEFADSDSLQVGETIFAIGSPFGKDFFNTVTSGIISGLGRKFPSLGDCEFITSDVAINPGNSGGPVFNTQGKIIGIAVAIVWFSEGLGIITPSNTCSKLLYDQETITFGVGKPN